MKVVEVGYIRCILWYFLIHEGGTISLDASVPAHVKSPYLNVRVDKVLRHAAKAPPSVDKGQLWRVPHGVATFCIKPKPNQEG